MRKCFYLSGLLVCCFLLLSGISKAAAPVISANPQNDTVCSGASAYFTLAASDTDAHPTTLSYSWLVSANGGASWSLVVAGGIYSLHSDSLVVTSSVMLNGYLFKAVATDSTGSDTSSAALLLVDSSNHGIFPGPTSVCLGAQITLSDSGSRGIWSASNDSAYVSPTTGIVTGLLIKIDSSGIDTSSADTVYYTINNTCITGIKDSVIITINPLPKTGVITGASIVCKGATITLADTVLGGTWTVRHPAIDSVSSLGGVVRGLAQGFDTVVYTTTNGLCNASVTHPVRVDTFVTALPITGPTTTCVGHTIDLMNVNVLGTWVWSASNTHDSISHSGLVHGVSHGLDTFTYSFTNACNTVISTTTVQTDTLLYPGVISGATAVCAGSWIHLTETITGGVWLSSMSSLAIVDGSGNVTGVAIGTPVISYLVSNGCGDVAATHTVTVNIPAGTITGISDSVGIDSTLSLSNITPGGTWSISNDTIATINSGTGVVTGATGGTATVTYTVTNSCGTSYSTMTLYVGPPPSSGAITGLDSVCMGSNITLYDTTAAIPGGIWSSSGDSIATVSSSGVVTGVAYGSVTITYTVQNAFGTTFQAMEIYVNEPPVVAVGGPSIVSLTGDYFLFGAPLGGGWSASNNIMGSFVYTGTLTDTLIDSVRYPYVTVGSFVVINYGRDTLTYTVENTCGIRSNYFVVNLPNTSNHTPIVTDKNAALNIYPNPNRGEFTLNMAAGSSEKVAVTITNMLGEKVRELTISTNKNYDIKLDGPDGVYLIFAIASDGSKYYSQITVAN